MHECRQAPRTCFQPLKHGERYAKDDHSFCCRCNLSPPALPPPQSKRTGLLPAIQREERKRIKGGSHYRCVSWRGDCVGGGGGGGKSNDDKESRSSLLLLGPWINGIERRRRMVAGWCTQQIITASHFSCRFPCVSEHRNKRESPGDREQKTRLKG